MRKFTLVLLSMTLIGFGADSTMGQTGPSQPIYATPEELAWKDAPSIAPGAKIVVLEGDMTKPAHFTARIMVPAGVDIAPHTHPTTERVTVISGTLHFAHGAKFDRSKTKAFPAGSLLVMPTGMPMYAFCEKEIVIQLNGVGPWGIFYLNPEDDPQKQTLD